MDNEIREHLRYNFIVNLMDGGFFGFAIGIASFVTVIPLFVNTMSNSVLLIGLIPAIHSMGWQLPQLLTGHRVTRMARFKPMVLWMTLHERLPFLGLAVVAFLLPRLGSNPALVLTYLLLIWQGLGGGFAATAWQSMIGKVIPPKLRGTFYGMQSATANLFAAVGAFIAGFILQNLPSPTNFVVCFLVAGCSLTFSMIFLGQTREPPHVPVNRDEAPAVFWNRVGTILRTDGPFRQFMLARIMLQFAGMAFSFYIIYLVQRYNAPPETTGLLTTVFMATQIVANPLMGWIGDHSSQLFAMLLGVLAAGASIAIAMFAPDATWFYAVLVLAGVANVGMWTAALAMTLEFGTDGERPAYIGLTNTLLAPVTILTPVLGGWLAEQAGYSVTFLISLFGAGITTAILALMLWQRAGRVPAGAPTLD